MKPETVNRILQAIDAEVQRVGFKNWDDAMAFVRQIHNAPDGVLRWGGRSDRIVTRTELEKLYSEEPEPTRNELQYEIRHIRGICIQIRKALVQTIKEEIPRDPGGRRPKVDNPQKQKQLVQQTASLIAKGTKTTDALRRVAQKNAISLRSLQRIWSARRTEE
jgi:hypothetical protein